MHKGMSHLASDVLIASWTASLNCGSSLWHVFILMNSNMHLTLSRSQYWPMHIVLSMSAENMGSAVTIDLAWTSSTLLSWNTNESTSTYVSRKGVWSCDCELFITLCVGPWQWSHCGTTHLSMWCSMPWGTCYCACHLARITLRLMVIHPALCWPCNQPVSHFSCLHKIDNPSHTLQYFASHAPWHFACPAICHVSIGLHLLHRYIRLLLFPSLTSFHKSPCMIQSCSRSLYDTTVNSCTILILEPQLLRYSVLGELRSLLT